MPDPNSVSAGANGGRLDFSGAPGADVSWDDLFPNPENPTALSPQATQGTQPTSQPQAASQPFLQAGDTVYNTKEDAATGLAHKDSVVAKYRNFLAQNGFDPNALLKDEFVRPQPQVATQPTQPVTQNSEYKYYGNPNFFEEVASAASNRDKVKYEQLMSAHAREAAQAAIREVMDPWRPTLAETNRFKAVRQTATEIPGFREFVDGPGYKKVIDNFPLYKEMIQIGENDPVAAQRLPEVYKSMYLIYQGMNQPQGQSQSTNSTTQVNPTVSRPTLQSSSLTPPAPAVNTAGWADPNWRGNRSLGNEARKQLIQDGDTKFQGMRFEDVNL